MLPLVLSIHNLQLSVEKVQRRFLKCLSFKHFGIYPQRGIDCTFLLGSTWRLSLKLARFVWKLFKRWIDGLYYLLPCLNFFIPSSTPAPLLAFSRTNLVIATARVSGNRIYLNASIEILLRLYARQNNRQ